MRIAHVISEYSRHEAMGRTIAETVARVDAEHFLVAARVHDGRDLFEDTYEVGGDLATFAFRRGEELGAALDEIDADIVHVHGGALSPLWVRARSLRHRRLVLSIYGWPRVPRPHALRRATWRQLTSSNVLRSRVVLSTLLPSGLARSFVRRSDVIAVLSPDPDARLRLDGCGVPVIALPSGAERSHHRAAYDAVAPVVVFAGRAEMVRGIDNLLDAFTTIRHRITNVRLRLLLIPTPELPDVLAQIDAMGLGDAVEVRTEPVADLSAHLAAAQVGVWPFKFDYTTSPPAMALAEAMAAGLPVVSTDVTCVRSIAQHEVNATLVQPGRSVRLALAIEELLTDQRLWEARAAAGLHTIEVEASWDRAAACTAQAYQMTSDTVLATAGGLVHGSVA